MIKEYRIQNFDHLLEELKLKNQKLFEQKNWQNIRLNNCSGKQPVWKSCKRGLYIFFDQIRSNDYRIVRIGTHSIKSGGSNTTLWDRLRQHKGIKKTGGGNHRGSIFRLLVGDAIIHKDNLHNLYPKWDQKKSISTEVKSEESKLEITVSNYIRKLPFIILKVDPTLNGPKDRDFIERNLIAYISIMNQRTNINNNWLGLSSSHSKVKKSFLWNNKHVFEDYDINFLKFLEKYINEM